MKILSEAEMTSISAGLSCGEDAPYRVVRKELATLDHLLWSALQDPEQDVQLEGEDWVDFVAHLPSGSLAERLVPRLQDAALQVKNFVSPLRALHAPIQRLAHTLLHSESAWHADPADLAENYRNIVKQHLWPCLRPARRMGTADASEQALD